MTRSRRAWRKWIAAVVWGLVLVGTIGGVFAGIWNEHGVMALLGVGRASLPTTTEELMSTRGAPLLRCEGFEFVPFDGGATRELTQVNFQGVAPPDDARFYSHWVYVDGRAMPTASVEAFHKEGRKSLHQSFFPSIEYEIYELNDTGGVLKRNFVKATHMLLLGE